jgi:hypothetical protein
METKTVFFDYFEVWCHELGTDGDSLTERKFDLTTVLQSASEMTPRQTMRKFRGEKARVQQAKLANGLWEIQLLRLREKSLPGVAKDDGDFQIIKLEDGEYIGESNSLLYDKENFALVMQRNYNGFTPSGVEDYLSSVISPESSIRRIILKPIIADSRLGIISRDKIFRTLEIGVATGAGKKLESPSLNSMLSNFLKFEGATYKVRISVGRAKRDTSLSPGLTVDTVKELYGDSSVTDLKIWLKDNEDIRAEKVDLLDDRRQDFVALLADRENPITHDRVYLELERIYSKRKKENKIFDAK